MRRLSSACGIMLACATAHAELHLTLVPELKAGAGYDDNLFLDANPAGLTSPRIRADAIFDVEPRVAGRLLVRGHRLSVTASALERLTLSNGELRDLVARADYLSAPLGPLAAIGGGWFERYDATLFPSDTFNLGGGEAGAQLSLWSALRLQLLYRVDGRFYSDPTRSGQTDREQWILAALRARVASWLTIELGYSHLDLASSEPTAELTRNRGDVSVLVRPFHWLLVAADYGLGAQHLPHGALMLGAPAPRDDLLQAWSVAVTSRPLSFLELFVRYSGLDSAASAPTESYHRNQVLGGFSIFVELQKEIAAKPPALAPTVRGGQVTFRVRTRPGAHVAIVGDWNGWDPAGGPLAPGGGDLFEGTYRLPVGRHAYAISIDGATRAPPEAPAYADDGFGGKNGIVEVR